MNVDELRSLFLFDGLTDAQLLELMDAGEEATFAEGEQLFHQGEPADFWWVLLEGRVELLRRAGHEETTVGAMERPGVWAGGFRAWADQAGYMASGRAASPCRLLRVPAPALAKQARSWFPFGVHLIEGFFQTVRSMEATSRQREALVALGTLAAGLAHEINNPASAAARAVDGLNEACDALLSSLSRLAQGSLRADQFLAMGELRHEIGTFTGRTDPLAVADREEALADWLERQNVGSAWQLAPTLAAAGVDVAWCERMAQVLDAATLEPGLDWVASTLATSTLLSEVKEATARVSALVSAVKSYSQLDRASLQMVDLTDGIESTLVMLHHKTGPGVEVVRDYGADVPQIEAQAGELNQVWTNVIDNALDAMDGSGTLRISTMVEGDDVVVEIADTGPGMPPEVQAHAFDPFFTTKDVGKGTGLGLDISRRIVAERHHGEIGIDSRPGATVVRVRLPAPRSQPRPEERPA